MDRSLLKIDEQLKARILTLVLTVLFSFSSLVLFEPAPFDMLFFPVAGIFLIALRGENFSRLSYPSYLMLFIFVALGALSIWVAPKIPRAIIYHFVTIYLCILSLFICMVCQVKEVGYLKAVVRGFAIGITVAGIFGIMAFYHIIVPHELFTKFGRVAGTYKDPNVFGPAAVLALNLILFLPIFQGEEKRYKWLDLAIRLFMASVLVLAILLSFSRAAIALLIVSITVNSVLLLFMKQIKIKVWHTVLISVIGLGLVIIAPFLIDIDFLMHRLQAHEYDNNRFGVQGKAILEAMGSIWGRGPGQSEILFLKFAVTQNTGATHNSYVRMMVENGWVALVMYVGYLFTALLLGTFGVLKVRQASVKKLKSQTNEVDWRKRALAIVFCASVLHTPLGIIIDTIHWRHFYIIFGMMIGLACYFLSQPNKLPLDKS